MSKYRAPEIDKDHLDLDEIFPTYAYYYNFFQSNYNSNYRSPFIGLNNKLYNLYHDFSRYHNKNGACCCRISHLDVIDLGRYLYYLKEKFRSAPVNQVHGCTYFIYKLIQALRNFGCDKNLLHSTYQKIAEYLGKKIFPPNYLYPDVCNHLFNVYDSVIKQHIDETNDIIHIFGYMDILYQNILQIHSRYWNYYYRKIFYDAYKSILKLNYSWGNHGISLVMEEFKKSYERYNTCYDCYNNKKHVLKLPSLDDIRRENLPKENVEEQKGYQKQQPIEPTEVKRIQTDANPKLHKINRNINTETDRITLEKALKMEMEDTNIASFSIYTMFLIFETKDKEVKEKDK